MPNSRVARSQKMPAACDAHHRNRQRHSREHAKHKRIQTFWSEYFGADVFERGGSFDRLIHRHFANNSGDRRDERIGICAGMDEKPAAKYRTALVKRPIDGEHGLWNDVYIVNIAATPTMRCGAMRRAFSASVPGLNGAQGPSNGHADSRHPDRGHPLRERFTDNNDGLLTFTVEIFEVPACDDGNA